jgi:hypothetical protein
MYYQQNFNLNPEAYITVNKKRIRQYGKNVYMDNNQEFEIELYNPTNQKVLAVITLNGKKMTGGGIVINPGQRIFLERYLDSKSKLLFETYDVENTNEVLNAISNNGNVDISFYKEESNPNTLLSYNNNVWKPDVILGNLNGSNYISIGAQFTTNSTINTTLSSNYFTTNVLGLVNGNTIETGRVEKGSNSDQEFVSSKDKFENKAYYQWSWVILPTSVKPYDSKDLKKYCTNCGSKIKKDSYKFCPNCGTKI